MTKPNFATKPFLVPAGAETPVNAVGAMLFNIASDDNLFLRIGEDGNKVRFNEGDKYQMPDGQQFERFYLINETGADVIVTVGMGTGNITVANQVSIAGTVKTDDDATQAALATLETAVETMSADLQAALEEVEVEINDMMALMQNDQDKRTGLTTFDGATYAAQSGTGTNNVVTALANVNGVIIRHGMVVGQANSTNRGQILVGGNPLIDTFTGVGGNSPIAIDIKDVFVPAGQAISLVCTFNLAFIRYEVL